MVRRTVLRSITASLMLLAPVSALAPATASADPTVVYPGMEIHQENRVCTLGFVDVRMHMAYTAGHCRGGGNVTDQETCGVCRDPRRSPATICVVEEAKDVVAIERTREFRGLYHVLGGAISPIDGIGPDDLRIRQLLGRLADGVVTEVIIATDPNLEGEATATYLARLLDQPGLRVSRLASGLPVGGDLEYADEITLGRAFEGRRLVER